MEPYVLCVSTIEVRKNHLLLFRAWRRLVEEMPAGTVPKLVLAGGIGWLVDDLMQQMRNAAFLDGRVEVVPERTSVHRTRTTSSLRHRPHVRLLSPISVRCHITDRTVPSRSVATA